MTLRRTILAIACIASSGLLWSGAASVAARRPPVHGDVAPMGTLSDVLVDVTHKKIFMASGVTGKPRIGIADLTGNVTGWFQGIPAATHLTINGPTLYAMMPEVPAIGVIDIPSLKEVEEMPLSPPPDPHNSSLVFAGDRLWYIHCAGTYAELVSIDPSNDLTVPYRMDMWCPTLYAAKGNPDRIVSFDSFREVISVIDVSGLVPLVAGQQSLTGGAGDFEVAPDSTTVYRPWESTVEEIDLESLSVVARYHMPGFSVRSIAVSESGNRIAASGVSHEGVARTAVFRRAGAGVPDVRDALVEYDFGAEPEFAFHPDEDSRHQRLYLFNIMSYLDGPLNVVVAGDPTELDVKFTRAYDRRGRHYKFRTGVSPVFVGRVKPVHRRIKVTLHIGYKYSRHTWSELGEQDFKLDDRGRVAVRFPASLFRFRPGETYSVSMEFPGDDIHPAAQSWRRYMHFTR